MFDESELGDVHRAGYRVLRPLGLGSGPWLAVRESEDVPVVLRDCGADSSSSGAEGSLPVDDIVGIVPLVEVFTTSSNRIVSVERYFESGPLLQGRRLDWLTPGEAATVARTLLGSAIDAWSRGGALLPLRPSECVLDADGTVAVVRGVRWCARTERTGIERALRELTEGLRSLAPALPGFADCIGPRRVLGPSDWPEQVAWLEARFPQSALGSEAPVSSGQVLERVEIGAVESDLEDAHAAGWNRLGSHIQALRRRFGSVARRSEQAAGAPRRTRLLIVGAGVAALSVVGGWVLTEPERSAPPTVQPAASSAVPTSSSDAAPTGLPGAAPAPANEPAVVAVSLMAQRAGCDDSTSSCLSAVDEPGSALLSEDRARLARGEPVRASFRPTEPGLVVSNMGSAVLVRLSTTSDSASVLLVQSETEWRIRDVFD